VAAAPACSADSLVSAPTAAEISTRRGLGQLDVGEVDGDEKRLFVERKEH
jgi:hypothetical protein